MRFLDLMMHSYIENAEKVGVDIHVFASLGTARSK
jgi:hypothetical protein